MVKKLKARTGGEKGRHLRPPLVQKLESRSVKKKSKKLPQEIFPIAIGQDNDKGVCVLSRELGILPGI